jgi:hypothetical protein
MRTLTVRKGKTFGLRANILVLEAFSNEPAEALISLRA